MSPGVNDGPRHTGTVPKSNRRNDRNRERSNSNNQIITRSTEHRDVLHQPNNLLEWHLVTDPHRSEKNSNTRSTSSAPSIGYQELAEFDYGIQQQHQRNYVVEERGSQWQRMAPPPIPDSHTQSPPPATLSQGNKPTNVDKMPDRGQVESRLNQIRDYIRVTSTMMDSLSQSSDPRAIAQHEKLSKMVEDLYDSETKLDKLLETYQSQGMPDENGEAEEHGDAGREAQLHRKVEETQRKLAILQEQEASLLGMQLRARERLNEARQAQQVFLQQGEQSNGGWEGSERQPHQGQAHSDQLESEHAALRGKLVQLQNKKKRMDHLVAELQAVDSSDRGSCSSEGSRPVGRDKVAELDAMKAQLAHLKALMKEATRDRHLSDSEGEAEPDEEVQAEQPPVNSSRSSIDRQSEPDDSLTRKSRNSIERPTVDQVQAVTRELREQSVLLQAARAELQRLKQTTPTPVVVTTSTPPPSLLGLSISEKKQSNNNTNNNSNDEQRSSELQFAQAKRRQLEELMRKEQGHSSSVNRDIGSGDWGATRETNSQLSHASVSANLWPLPTPTAVESNDQSVDGVSTSENLLDVGTNANLTTMNGNWWGVPPAPPLGIVDQPPQGVVGTAEYYRQLLLGSQAQQLQMMGMTMQQCCQLLWAQQRELQSMRAAIVQLQLHLRQPQQLQHQQQQPQHQHQQGRANNNYNNVGNTEDYSNLSRAVHHNGNSLDTNLPPSSSLPNLVAIPTPSQIPANNPPPHHQQQQQQQQQQLNNQVPPGNRANNYWDNFRSYSRQNLLSVNGKTERNPHTTQTTPATNTVSSAPSVSSTGGSNSGLTSRKDKRNREHGLENLSLPTSLAAEIQYPQNLQLQSNYQQQETLVNSRSSLSNVLANDTTQQQQSQNVDNLFDEQQSACARLMPANNDGQVSLRQLSDEMSEAVASLVTVNSSRPGYLVRVLREVKIICEDHRLRPRLLRSLRALRDSHSPNNPLVGWLQNETTDQTASESCQSSDEDSDTGTMNNTGISNAASQAVGSSSLPPPPLPPPPLPSLPLPLLPVVPVFENAGGSQAEGVGVNASVSVTPGYNEDLAEADQSRPEASHNHQVTNEDHHGAEEVGDTSTASASALIADLVAEMESFEEEGERSEDIGLDRVPTRLYHQANESA